MKHIKPYNIFESQEPQHPGFPKTEEEIHELCKKYVIINYTINKDLSVDVEGGVNLISENLDYLPLNFNYVNGNFDCFINYLISLEGSPHNVDGHFICSTNKLTSLKGGPKKINGNFYCSGNNIKSLDYFQNIVNCSNILIHNNPIHSVVNIFIRKDNSMDLVQEFNDYDIVRGDKVVLGRLEAFINDFDLGMPNLDEVRKYYTIV